MPRSSADALTDAHSVGVKRIDLTSRDSILATGLLFISDSPYGLGPIGEHLVGRNQDLRRDGLAFKHQRHHRDGDARPFAHHRERDSTAIEFPAETE